MSTNLEDRCRKLVEELEIGQPQNVHKVAPLTGGVASDIARFDLGGQSYCAKFALAKLKVAEDWFAPVHRNAAEYAWLTFAAETCPESAVRLFGRSERTNGFVMEFIAGDDVSLWKSDLLGGNSEHCISAGVAELLGRLQSASAQPEFNASEFQNRDDFHDLRIEPYLTFTSIVHRDLATPLNAMGDALYHANNVLVHGDVSPKNILLRKTGPVFLDAECATMGDACFDPSFCLNHLILKAIHMPETREERLTDVLTFWTSYQTRIDFEDTSSLQARIACLVPMLMLARIDGKSPVEYLSDGNRTIVREIARGLILNAPTSLDELVQRIQTKLNQLQPPSTTMV